MIQGWIILGSESLRKSFGTILNFKFLLLKILHLKGAGSRPILKKFSFLNFFYAHFPKWKMLLKANENTASEIHSSYTSFGHLGTCKKKEVVAKGKPPPPHNVESGASQCVLFPCACAAV